MSSNSTEAIEGSGCRHVIIRLDNGRVCRLVPSAEQLIEVSDAAINLADAAQKSFCISGQDDPFSFPHYVRPRQIPYAILRLERALNPRCLAFDDPLRPQIMTHGWPVNVADGLGWLRRLHDEVLVAWNVEALCGTKCVLLLQSRLVAPHQIDRNGKTIKASWWVDFQRLFDSKSHDGVVQIEMPQDWPPKIDRAILESMAIAASWIKEAVEDTRPSGRSAADEDYRSGQWFAANTDIPASRLRHAASKERKNKRVRTKAMDGVICYSVADVQRWWSGDIPDGVKMRTAP